VLYSPRPRRFRRTATQAATRAGYLTATALMVRNGVSVEIAERYSAQITKTAARAGVTPAAVTYDKRNGRARAARAYDLAADGMALLLALVSYRPAAPRRLKNGQPSTAKSELAKAVRLAEYTRAIGALALVA
jgi:hypothetical protein